MTTYEKFKHRVGCRKDNTVYITPYTIEVIPDDMRKATQWDKLQYLMSEGKVIKIFIAEPNRSVDELTFDFYREVGRFLMYKQLIDTYDPEKYFKRSSVKSQYAKIIDDYFNMFGYKTHRVKTPHENHRKRYWYTKTIDCDISGGIPNNDMQKIKDCYNKGVTFWKGESNIGKYYRNFHCIQSCSSGNDKGKAGQDS
jgi:hypothetical protein